MLSNNERRLIRRNLLLPKVTVTSFVMIPVIAVLFALTCAIFDVEWYELERIGSLFPLFLILEGVLSLLFVLSFFKLRAGLHSPEWQNIVAKVPALHSSDDDLFSAFVGPTPVGSEIIPEAEGLSFGGWKKYVAPIVIVPLVIYLACLIPYYRVEMKNRENAAVAASETIEQLKAAFAGQCQNMYFSDPYEKYYPYGYSFSATRSRIDNIESRFYLSVRNDGKIDHLTYHIDLDLDADPQANLEMLYENITFYSQCLQSVDAELFTNSVLYSDDIVSPTFAEKFQNGSYYEDIDQVLDYGDYAINCYLIAYDESEVTDYTRPYFSIYISTR